MQHTIGTLENKIVNERALFGEGLRLDAGGAGKRVFRTQLGHKAP